MQRRTFLKYGLFGSALLALGGVGLHAWPIAGTYRARRKLRVLGDLEFRILCHVAARVVPDAAVDPHEVAHGVDEILSYTHPEAASDMNQLLRLIESALGGLVLDLRPRPFSHLPAEAQERALAAWRDSKLSLRRTGYAGVCKLCTAAFYRSEARWVEVGYPGPPKYLEVMAAQVPAAPGTGSGAASQ